MPDTQKSAITTGPTDKGTKVFTEEERAAIQDRAQELKTAGRPGSGTGKTDDEAAFLAKIAEMSASDRALGEQLRAIVGDSAPELKPKLWYGMPAWAKDGKVVCFFQSAAKFKTRYAMLGFNDAANLDEGTVWPVYFALTALTVADEAKIGALVKKAMS
jgi:uncharacterized protein YdhG (YjbR/CyaY superfamily)